MYQWPLLIGWLILARHICSARIVSFWPPWPQRIETENPGKRIAHVLVWKHVDGDSLLGADAPTVEWASSASSWYRGGGGGTERND